MAIVSAGVNLSKNPGDIGDWPAVPSPRNFLNICLVQQASGASLTSDGETL